MGTVIEPDSPSTCVERSKSQNNLLDRRIAPFAQLERELAKGLLGGLSTITQILMSGETESQRPSTPSLSARRLFFATPPGIPTIPSPTTESLDSDLTSCPVHVEPYPEKAKKVNSTLCDAASQRRIEGVYDQYLLATPGVRRVGKGYQSDKASTVLRGAVPSTSSFSRIPRILHTTRRANPSPVVRDGRKRALSIDELGAISCSTVNDESARKGVASYTASLVRRALKSINRKAAQKQF